MNKKDLPIGTVVLLNGGFKKVMITGYSSVSPEKEETFDYNGCIFPEGLMENVYCLFNADQIDEIFYYGLENEEYKDYVENKQSVLENSHSSHRLEKGISSSKKERRNLRTPSSPTKPRSKSEMKEKYGITKISGKDDLPPRRY